MTLRLDFNTFTGAVQTSVIDTERTTLGTSINGAMSTDMTALVSYVTAGDFVLANANLGLTTIASLQAELAKQKTRLQRIDTMDKINRGV